MLPVRVALISLLLVLPAASALPAVDVGAAAHVWAGDMTFRDTTLDLVGTVLVAPGARVTLDHVTLRFHAAQLVVAPGGTLTSRDSSFLDPDVLVLGSSYLARGEWTGANAAGLTVADAGRLEVRDVFFHDIAAGITVRDTENALVERSLFSNVSGIAPVVVQAGGLAANAVPTAATLRDNLILETTSARAIYLGGASAATRVEGNAVAASGIGIETAYGAGGLVRANRVAGIGAAPLEGLRANGTPATGAPVFRARFVENRVEGFPIAAEATGNDAAHAPRFRGNALLGAIGLAASAPVNARGNWWGDESGPRDANASDGSTPSANGGNGSAVVGPADYRRWLASDPTSDGLLVATLREGHVELASHATSAMHVTLLVDGTRFEDDLAAQGHVEYHVDAHVAVLALGEATDGTVATAVAVPQG